MTDPRVEALVQRIAKAVEPIHHHAGDGPQRNLWVRVAADAIRPELAGARVMQGPNRDNCCVFAGDASNLRPGMVRYLIVPLPQD